MTDVQIFHNYLKKNLAFGQTKQHHFQLTTPPSPRRERSLCTVPAERARGGRWVPPGPGSGAAALQSPLGIEPVGTEPEKRSDLWTKLIYLQLVNAF